jgi:hypothetical protein
VAIEQRLIEELSAVVPGAQEVDASVRAKGESIDVQASISWAPPGPDLIPVVIQARASTPIVIPP